MRLITVGTGSSGNTYLLTNGTETLVIDAGVPFMEVKKALDFVIQGIVGVIVTHTHKDHSKYASDYATAGIPVWKPYETAIAKAEGEDLARWRIPHTRIGFGGFDIQSFECIHDVPCVGYVIQHKDIGKMVYVTDTEYVRYTFRNLNVLLVEANYSDAYINREAAKYRHVLTGHMSIDTAVSCIKVNASPDLNHVILCHLSDGWSNEKEFLEAVKAVVPAGCTVDVADAGRVVDVGLLPF